MNTVDMNDALVYKEDDNIKTFISKNYNFVFDKKMKMSLSWGQTKMDDPSYDPISPNEMNLIIDDNFDFINYKDIFEIIINKQIKDDKMFLMSTITNFNLIINDLNSNCFKTLKFFIEYLNYYDSIVTVYFKYDENLSLKDILKLKSNKIENIMLIVDEQHFDSNKLENFIKLCFSKGLFVSCKFMISKNNFNDFINQLDNFPKNTFSEFEISKPKITIDEFNKIIEKINSLQIGFIFNTDKVGDIKINQKINEGALFSCVVDFKNEKIYPDLKNKKYYVKFNNIKSINDYWYSDQFIEVRNKKLVNESEK